MCHDRSRRISWDGVKTAFLVTIVGEAVKLDSNARGVTVTSRGANGQRNCSDSSDRRSVRQVQIVVDAVCMVSRDKIVWKNRFNLCLIYVQRLNTASFVNGCEVDSGRWCRQVTLEMTSWHCGLPDGTDASWSGIAQFATADQVQVVGVTDVGARVVHAIVTAKD
jgi:hypothetical protein